MPILSSIVQVTTNGRGALARTRFSQIIARDEKRNENNVGSSKDERGSSGRYIKANHFQVPLSHRQKASVPRRKRRNERGSRECADK